MNKTHRVGDTPAARTYTRAPDTRKVVSGEHAFWEVEGFVVCSCTDLKYWEMKRAAIDALGSYKALFIRLKGPDTRIGPQTPAGGRHPPGMLLSTFQSPLLYTPPTPK